MQAKTIAKIIEKKINDWLITITDDNLRYDLRSNVLVSGGSIASLLQGQTVNDYDVYIMDINVLKRLVIYYTKDFNSVEIFDGRDKAAIIDKYRQGCSVESFMKHQSYTAVSVRTLKDDQIKIFIDGGGGGYKVDYSQKLLAKEDLPEYRPVFFSPNAISLSDDLQIVVRFWGDAEQIHKTFDFVHATNYWTQKDGMVLNVAALTSILTRTLKYQGSLYPLTSIIRSKKFIGRGMNIGAGEYLKIMYQISMLDLSDMDVLEEQLIGVDVAYFSMLIEALRVKQESEPGFKPTESYMNELIERIFNEN